MKLQINLFFQILLYFASSKKIDDQSSSPVDLNTFSYQNQGRDWPGLCNSGKYQSPINIIDEKNTVFDFFGALSFKYQINSEFAFSKEKFYYDGKGLTLKADIGEMQFTHEDMTVETYKAESINIHFPSEHAITIDSMTPRYPIEMQIVHSLVKTTSVENTNKHIKVKQAIISILFKDDSIIGERFFNRLGFSEDTLIFKDQIQNKKGIIDISNTFRGSVSFSFDIDAMNAIKNILNFNHHIYRYYGSMTTPPCTENVQWFVFAKPRAISKAQLQFFKKILIKERAKSRGNENINVAASKFYGNNRQLQVYDEYLRGKIYSMVRGIKSIEDLQYPKS